MSLSEEKAKKIRLLEKTRFRRAQLQAEIEKLQDDLAQERTSRLIGEGGDKIPSLQKVITQLEEELASLQVDQVLSRQIEELGQQEHQEAIKEAEAERTRASQALEETVTVYRQKRLEILDAAAELDKARDRVRSAHMRIVALTGAPWYEISPLYAWDGQQLMALRILQGVIDGFKAAEEFEELRRRNPQLYGITVGPDGASEPGGGEGRH